MNKDFKRRQLRIEFLNNDNKTTTYIEWLESNLLECRGIRYKFKNLFYTNYQLRN
jgi:hypothetical protein